MLSNDCYYLAKSTNNKYSYCWSKSIDWLRKHIGMYIPNYTERGSFRLYIVNEKGEKITEFLKPEEQLWKIKD